MTISLIIPVWNRKALFSEALESALSGSLLPSEIIIADDGSDDPEALKAYEEGRAQSKEKGVPCRLLILPHSGFPGKVRNEAAREAKGGLLAFLDSDDLMAPQKLEKQALWFESHPEGKILYSDEQWVLSGKDIRCAPWKKNISGDVFEPCLRRCFIGASTIMMRRALYLETGGFREDLEIGEDYEYWIRLADRFPFGCLPEKLTFKRSGGWEQLSAKYDQIEIFRIRALKDLIDSNALTEPHTALARKELAAKARRYARGAEKRGHTEEACLFGEMAMSYEVE